MIAYALGSWGKLTFKEFPAIRLLMYMKKWYLEVSVGEGAEALK